MRRIYVRDGDSFVWQWQPKEHIVLEGYPEGVFVHYANCDTKEAPVVQSRMDGEKLIAPIPPELMQVDKDLTVYVCDEVGTKHCHFLTVLGRPKPENYVTEPVEILRYETLAARIPFDDKYTRKMLYVVDGVALPLSLGEGVSVEELLGGGFELTVQGGGGPAEPGTPGGYYVPIVSQTSTDTMTVEFFPSSEDLTTVGSVTIHLPEGKEGDPGRGIRSIDRTSGNGAAGTVDTYTITYTDETTSTYQVRNGNNGVAGTTPHVGNNGNWYIGTTDTGVKAQGPQGVPGKGYTLTDDDKNTIANIAIRLLPKYNGEVSGWV